MKAARVFLRWYKSFNINYLGYDDRRSGQLVRPWNTIESPDDPEAYRFIEIPLDERITTVVGANESGKSHLLSAIRKVVKGAGTPDFDGSPSQFDLTDLCHYSSLKNKNAEVWPHIGVEFVAVDPSKMERILTAAGRKLPPPLPDKFVLMLLRDDLGHLYLEAEKEVVVLDRTMLDQIRNELPKVEFIQSDKPLADEVAIDDLLEAMAKTRGSRAPRYSFEGAQAAAKLISSLSGLESDKIEANDIAEMKTVKALLSRMDNSRRRPQLELKLFCDVLGIEPDTFERVAKLDSKQRSYAESLVSIWNEEIDRVLNLSRFWQQDDQFTLRMNYKDRIFYFEITDKTGSVYTFRERSSGLRYFLSYYIQAKAIEAKYANTECIILMDEPDSFLSIAGQRNLLAVFESLSGVSSNHGIQLIYTTHSPFLINPNFPNRIRLVRKGDAEEGTQYVDESRLRRYEPIRSALGIDCAQTLFMGEANIVLEGPTDQLLLAELCRLFSVYRDPLAVLDLSNIVLMSAESAPGVEQVLKASKWSDERVPAAVVLFDEDEEGRRQLARITGQQRGLDALIASEFVLTVADAIGKTVDGHKIVSIEDVVPISIYREAIQRYLEIWYSDVLSEKRTEIETLLNDAGYGAEGLVISTNELFKKFVNPTRKMYDKFGVVQEAIAIVKDKLENWSKESGSSRRTETEGQVHPELPADLQPIQSRLYALCEVLRTLVYRSRQASRRASGSQSVIRIILDFHKRFKDCAPSFDVQMLLERLEREAKSLGKDGEELVVLVENLLSEIAGFRAAGSTQVKGSNWARWKAAIWKIRQNPLSPGIKSLDGNGGPVIPPAGESLPTAVNPGDAEEQLPGPNPDADSVG